MNTQTLLSLAQLFAAHRGMKLSTVSTYAAKDGKFFGSLITGSGCTIRRAEKVLDYFDRNWPADLEWPRHIPRPPKSKKEAA